MLSSPIKTIELLCSCREAPTRGSTRLRELAIATELRPLLAATRI